MDETGDFRLAGGFGPAPRRSSLLRCHRIKEESESNGWLEKRADDVNGANGRAGMFSRTEVLPTGGALHSK